MNFNLVLHIARKELKYVVFSPVGWIVFAIFAAQAGSVFVGVVEQVYELLAFGSQPRSVAGYFYQRSVSGVLSQTVDFIYLYIPLLTMAVFSREIQSGSIKLLMSSPLRPSEIVLGKYLAIVCFLLLFVAVIVLTLPISAIIAPNFDLPAVLPGILGFYLLACTYAAIGVFVSSLTKYQIVAAIITLAILFVLGSIANWFRETPLLNEVTFWASLSGRVSVFRDGMLATNHLVYFIAVVILFLMFTTLRVSGLRSGSNTIAISGKAGLATAIVASVGWFFSLPQFTAYLDTTYDRRNSLAPESVALMERIEGPWQIQTYANIFDGIGRIAMHRERISDRWRYRAYLQQNHRLSMDYDLYYDLVANDGLAERYPGLSEDEIAAAYARRVRLDSETLRSSEALESATGLDLAAEEYRTFRVFRWNGREARVRFFDDSVRFPQERTRAAALKRLVDGPVQISMLVSNGERRATRGFPTDFRRDFSALTNRWAVINHGFDIEEVASDDWSTEQTDILILADPREPYSQEVMNRIEAYFNHGGDVVLLVEKESASSVDALLAKLGLARGTGLLQSHEKGYPESLVLGATAGGVLTSYTGAEAFTVGLDGAIELLQISDDSNFERIPIVTAPDAGRVNQESLEDGSIHAPVVGFALERDVNGERQRVIVFGDADLYSTAHRDRREPMTNNGHLDAFYYLTEGQYPVQRTRRNTIDVTLNIERGGIDLLRWFLVGALPLGILLTGGWILMHRRRR